MIAMKTYFFLLLVFASAISERDDATRCKSVCKGGLFRIQTDNSCQCLEQVDDIITPVEPKAKAGIQSTTKRWDDITTDGFVRIPFCYNANVEYSSLHKSTINRALGVYNAISCLRFEPVQPGDVDIIEFNKAESSCFSNLGKIGGTQTVDLADFCADTAIIQHEVMHALGFYHEQSRPDRDDYVEVLEQNIRAGAESNFDKESFAEIESFNTSYDIRSLLHYASFAFSKNGRPTIILRATNESFDTQEIALSAIDQTQIRAMYNCSGKRGIPETTDCYHPLDRGFSYRGNHSTTKSGKTCQRWDSQAPHGHFIRPDLITGAGLENNYCRNADVGETGPWCYTTDPGLRYEECDIPVCANAVPAIAIPANDPGFWLTFSEWSACDATCGNGFQYRTRHCFGNTPGSDKCPGEYWESKPCPTLPQCIGTWSAWVHSECSVGCGTGRDVRIRNCIGGTCVGDVMERGRCQNKGCPLYPDRGCFDKSDLDSYRGRMSVDENGQTCIRWRQSELNVRDFRRKNLVRNRCRNPTDEPFPYCYINTNTTSRCNVSLCNEDAVWGNYSDWSDCDCQRGRRHSVRQCVGGVRGQGACRGQISRTEQCACTTDPPATPTPPTQPSPPTTTVINSTGCAVFGNASLYRGNVRETIDGKACQRWDSQVPHPHGYNSSQVIADYGLTENYCRAPDGDDWPWCYVLSFALEKQYCHMPVCIPDPPPPQPPVGCIENGNYADYRGGLNVTELGYTCQRWDLNTPHKHTYKPYEEEAEWVNWGLGPHNYCRASGESPTWCFTTDPTHVWDNCAVPACP